MKIILKIFGHGRESAHTLLLKRKIVFKEDLITMTKFFAAANTETGFQSLFSECFSPETHKRIYILKGGPGTGKSTIMKSIGFFAEASGCEVEYLYCSSDTSSLDGIRIPALEIAVLDGTAPHITDPIYPGAVERIVNLGDAFDLEGLSGERAEITSLCSAKGDAYRTAYRFLAAAGRVAHEKEDLLKNVFLLEKAEAAAGRLAFAIKDAEKGRETRRYLSAIGTHGYIKSDTLKQKAKRILAVTERHGLEYLFMNALYASLSRLGIKMTVCTTPLVSSHIEAIYVESERVLFAVMNETEVPEAVKIINCDRFVSREALSERRARLRFAEKCERSLMEGALSSLEEAGRIHENLEKIYGRYVDFSAVDRIKSRMISEIFTNNM